jgi:hypothetical protein
MDEERLRSEIFMASLGGWARLIVGLLLAAEVIREWVFNEVLSNWALGFAGLYVLLTAAYFVVKF